MNAYVINSINGFYISIFRPIVLVALLFSTSAVNADDIVLDYSSAWFQPELIDNKSDVCEPIAEAVFTEVLDPGSDFKPKGLEQVNPDKTIHRGRVWAIEEPIVSNNGEEIYLYSASLIGCGGACNQYFFNASESPMPPDLDLNSSLNFLRNTAGVGFSSPRLYKNSSSEYFVITESNEKTTVYYLDEQPEWHVVCSVQTGTSREELREHPEVQPIFEQLEALQTTVSAIRGGAGSFCGSSNAHGRSRSALENNLFELLFRPYTGEYSSTADSISIKLSTWGNQGIGENTALKEYQEQHAITLGVLSEFYQQQFKLNHQDATSIAEQGLMRAVYSGFSFSGGSYNPSRDSEDLRTAILERMPIDKIREFQISVEAINGSSDSMLNVAVNYPLALEYLLSLGASPNHSNPFGKTPLMYAAQNNALESAEILINAGADPNATTIIPRDRCGYTLSTKAMTPLHYAVRYASPELIDLLLLSGANTYTAAFTGSEYSEAEYPVDWLQEYAGPDSEEPNQYIGSGQYSELQAKLAVPTQDERARIEEELPKIADDLVARAEITHSEGDSAQAIALYRRALAATPQNERALIGMSQIGIELKLYDEAAAAAVTLIEQNSNSQNLAKAWFNLGLACHARNHRISYNDKESCNYNRIFYFLEAWKHEPNQSIKNEILDRFQELQAGYDTNAICEFEPNTAQGYYLGYGRSFRESLFYLLHESDWQPNANMLEWKERDRDPWENPIFVETIKIDDYSVSAFSISARRAAQARIPQINCELEHVVR